jgi:hypothetical protein
MPCVETFGDLTFHLCNRSRGTINILGGTPTPEDAAGGARKTKEQRTCIIWSNISVALVLPFHENDLHKEFFPFVSTIRFKITVTGLNEL